MDGTYEPALASSAAEIAEKIRFARPQPNSPGRTVFLVGAGCSISAGVQGAADIARHMVRVVAERFGCDSSDAMVAYRSLINRSRLKALHEGSPNDPRSTSDVHWHLVYDEMFKRHFSTPDDVRDLFDDLVSKADGAMNWAHLCLGELVAQRFVSTVLTTNFDQLVLAGLVRAGVLPVVCDGIESLNRIAGLPRHPQLVELHGSRHTYLLRNAQDDIQAVGRDPSASAAIQKLLQHATTFVVIGYGGREDGIMGLLTQAAKLYRDKNIFWISHSANPADVHKNVREFLATSRNSRLLPGQDADKFFLELCRALEIGSPRAISHPLEMIERSVQSILKASVLDASIRAEIDGAVRLLKRLQSSQPDKEPDPVEATAAAIRERRLGGDREGAYRLAEEALAG